MPQKKGQAKRLLHEGPVSGRKSDICDHSLKNCDHKAYFRYFTSRSDPSVQRKASRTANRIESPPAIRGRARPAAGSGGWRCAWPAGDRARRVRPGSGPLRAPSGRGVGRQQSRTDPPHRGRPFPVLKVRMRARRRAFKAVRSSQGQASAGSIALQASTRPFTESTDFWNIACSASFSLISTIFSIPPAPMIVGTPTYIEVRPYSPST